MTDERSKKALHGLVDEARRDATPELDWDAVERSLMARVAREERPTVTGAGRPSWLVPASLAALAALAAVGVFFVKTGAHDVTGSRDTSQASSTARRGNVNGDALAVGAVVAAGSEPVVVEHMDHVTWTLAPSGVARVESMGDVVGLALDRGLLSAHVTKSKRPESFVVRVENSRIAVHGTAFRVERLESTVRIEVTEGIVGIGPVSAAGKTGGGFELRAPGSAVVSFEGLRTDLPAQTEGATSPAAVATTTSPAPEAAPKVRPEGAVKAPEQQTARAAASDAPGVERVIQAVRRCLSEHTVAGGDLHVIVRTRMSLKVQANGHVGEALFTPPLAPAVQGCVDASVGSVGFSSSSGGFALDREIELDR